MRRQKGLHDAVTPRTRKIIIEPYISQLNVHMLPSYKFVAVAHVLNYISWRSVKGVIRIVVRAHE